MKVNKVFGPPGLFRSFWTSFGTHLDLFCTPLGPSFTSHKVTTSAQDSQGPGLFHIFVSLFQQHPLITWQCDMTVTIWISNYVMVPTMSYIMETGSANVDANKDLVKRAIHPISGKHSKMMFLHWNLMRETCSCWLEASKLWSFPSYCIAVYVIGLLLSYISDECGRP